MQKKVDFLEKKLRNFEGFWPFITRGDFLQVYRPKKFRLYAIPIWSDLSTVRQPKPNHFASFTKRNTKNHRFAPSKVDFLRFLVQKLHFLTFIYCRGTPMYTIWGVGALWALTLLWLICTSASVLASHSSQLGLSANLGLVWHMLSPCGPSGRQRGMGTLSVVSYSMSRVALGTNKGFECLVAFRLLHAVRIPALCLGGDWFWGTAASLASSLRRTSFSVTVVSLVLKTRFPLGFELVSYCDGFCFSCQPTFCCWRFGACLSEGLRWFGNNLVDPASSHMLVSKIKPCMSQYKLLSGETANGSLKQL